MRVLSASVLSLSLLAAGQAHALTAGPAERASPDRLSVSWTDQNPVDVFVAERPDATLADARLVSRANRSGRVDIPATADARRYVLLRDARDGEVVRVAERVVPLAQASNFRDVGGYVTTDGKHVRWGQIYRAGATPLLTDEDRARIADLHLGTMVDLRSSEERRLAPSRIEGVRYEAVAYPMALITQKDPTLSADERRRESYRRFPTLLAPQLKLVFDALLAGDGPVVYNCSAGQDRTGFTTAMVLIALGVPRETILADYHLSTALRRPEFEMPPIDPATAANDPVAALFLRVQTDPRYGKPQPLYDSTHRSLLDFALDEVTAKWGSPEAYLDKAIGVDAADIARLRAMYLE